MHTHVSHIYKTRVYNLEIGVDLNTVRIFTPVEDGAGGKI